MYIKLMFFYKIIEILKKVFHYIIYKRINIKLKLKLLLNGHKFSFNIFQIESHEFDINNKLSKYFKTEIILHLYWNNKTMLFGEIKMWQLSRRIYFSIAN